MASQIYHEVIQVEVRDQSQAALNNVQKNVEKTEKDLNRISKSPYSIVVKMTDMLTRPFGQVLNAARALAGRALAVPVTMVNRITAPFRNLMSGLREQGNQMVLGIGQGLGQALLNVAGQGIATVKGSIIGMNATLETSTLQFETLMGDADAARKHVQDLFQFAKETPFETQPIINASRMMRTFGGGALDTMANMTLFGDAAAATGSNIEEVGFWMGRAYAAIQAGQPFGEARMRLQELAIISPQAAQKIEALEKAGAKGDVVWQAFSGDLARFTGAMAKQAKTWTGLTSSLSDAIAITSAKMFEPLFEVAKTVAGDLLDTLSSADFEAWADDAGKGIAKFVENAGKGFGQMVHGIRAIQTAFSGQPGAIGVVYDLIRETFGDSVGDIVQPFLQKLMDFIPTLNHVGTLIGQAFGSLAKGDVRGMLMDLTLAFTTLTGISLAGLVTWVTKFGDAIGAWLPTVTATLPRLQTLAGDVLVNLGRAFQNIVGIITDVAGMTSGGGVGGGVIDWFGLLSTIILSATKAFADLTGWIRENKTVVVALVGAGVTLVAILKAIQGAIGVISFFKQAYDALQILRTGILAVRGAMLLMNAALLANPFALIVVAIAAFIAILVYAYNTNEDFRNFVNAAWEAIKNAISGAWDAIQPILENFGQAVMALWTDTIKPAIDGIVQLWQDLHTDTLGTLNKLKAGLLEIGTGMMNNLIAGIQSVDVLGWIRTNVTDKIPAEVKNVLGIHSPSGVFADIGNSLMQGLINGLTARLPDVQAFLAGLGGMFGGADVGGWISAAIAATGVPASWAVPLSQIIQGESGGNPLAANLTDVNAKAGNASVGLMQLTGTNRAQYTPAGMDPMDPIAQIIAGIRYIQARYGDISAVPGVRSLASGGAYQPYDSGGILPPGLTLAANNTGGNEFVLTPGQMRGLGSSVVFAPVFEIDARGAAPGVGEEVSAAVEAESSRLFSLLGSQLRVAFGNLALEGGAT
jgi:hypothetical protein